MQVRQKHFASWSGFSWFRSQTKTDEAGNKASSSHWQSHLEKEVDKKKGKVGELTQLPFDLVLSLLLGCSMTAFLHNQKALEQDFAQSPLVAGRSLIHQHVCPRVETVFQEAVESNQILFPSQQSDGIDTAWDDSLVTFATFLRNCKSRSDFIIHRQRRGDRNPDLVPYPGLQGMRRIFR